jgi:hypothetical protein
MSELPARNRVIYQSEALFISPDTTGHHVYYDAKHTEPDVNNCVITGEDINGDPLFLNACSGLVSSDVLFDTYTGLNNASFSSSGILDLDKSNSRGLSGLHPVFFTAGFSGSSALTNGGTAIEHLSGTSVEDFFEGSWGSSINQLKRVQSANYSFTVNRQDINQFGHLGRLDSVVLEAPTVSLDFSYYLTDGFNERMLAFVTNGQNQNLSGMMTRAQNDFGNNYFILTVPEGRDAVKGDLKVNENDKSVISIGNAFITDYSLEASVGSFPSVSVTVEGMNIKSDLGTQWKTIPAIDPTNGTLSCDSYFALPPTVSGDGESILKPGDITIDLKDASLISKSISGSDPGYGPEDKGSCHIQSFTLSTPMGRSDLQRLGNSYAYTKEMDFPISCTLTVNALVADLKEGNLVDLYCGDKYDMSITIKPPKCLDCEPNENNDAIVIKFNKALLDSESFSSAIGDNKTVDLTFSTQIGGPEEQGVGVFFSGSENDGNQYAPTIKNTGDFSKYFPDGFSD